MIRLPLTTAALGACLLAGCSSSSSTLRTGLATDVLSIPIATAAYGGTQSINLVASAAACSAAPCEDKSVALMFFPPPNSGMQLSVPEVLLLIDGAQTVIRTPETGSARQTVRIVVDPLSFARIATGRDVTITLGTTRLNLPASALQEMRTLANRMTATF